MPSAVTLTQPANGQAGIHVDMPALELPMRNALHRASIFLGYASHLVAKPPLSSIKLPYAIDLDVGVPDPIPPVERPHYQQEYVRWSIGQGLIELDQSYQRFVVSAIETSKDIEHFVTTRSELATHKANLANTWAVHEQFFEMSGSRLPLHATESGYLRTLGNARNCLAHDSGIVTERRLTEGDTMPIRWRGSDMFKAAPGGPKVLLPRNKPYIAKAQDIGSELSVDENVQRELIYKVGDVVAFSDTDLAEIIFFYQSLAMQVGAEAHERMRRAAAVLNV